VRPLDFMKALLKPAKRSTPGGDAPPKWAVRLAIGALALGAMYVAWTADAPTKLPGVALSQEFVCRGELFLAIFYGGLLIATPILRGVLSGLLPTEITARGAKYDREQVTGGLRQTEDRIRQLTEVVEASSGQLARLRKRVEQLEN